MFREAELRNGLRVIAEVVPGARSVALGYFVKTGARDETKEESGVSHFLEHMVFKGTERRTALDFARQMLEWHPNTMFDLASSPSSSAPPCGRRTSRRRSW